MNGWGREEDSYIRRHITHDPYVECPYCGKLTKVYSLHMYPNITHKCDHCKGLYNITATKQGGLMEKHLTYQNVSWTVKMYWEYPETLSCPNISSIYLEGSTIDLYDFLDQDTVMGLQAELVESLKD